MINPNEIDKGQQSKIIAKIEQYFAIKQRKFQQKPGRDHRDIQDNRLPFNNVEGICSALVALWFYCVRRGRAADFKQMVDDVLNWDAKEFSSSTEPSDIALEKLISNMLFVHHDPQIRGPQFSRRYVNKNLELILEEDQLHIGPAEFSLNLVADVAKTADIITKFAHQNKMIRFENLFHTVGVIYDGEVYHFYDPNYPDGPLTFNTLEQVSAAVHASLAKFNTNKQNIAMNMSVFDLDDHKYTKQVYEPSALDYSMQLFTDPEYKQLVLEDPNIFHLCATYDDTDSIKLLYSMGHKYRPWLSGNDSDLNEAIFNQDPDRIKFLVAQGADLEFRTKDGETCLGSAVRCKLPIMVYTLLAMGANPNTAPTGQASPLEIALRSENVETIILLLAYNADIPAGFLDKLQRKFGDASFANIKARAIELNAKLFSAPEQLNISEANGQQIIAFLHNAKLKVKLLNTTDSITVINEDHRAVSGANALKLIALHYQSNSANDLFDFNEKVEIYRLLKFFKPQDLEFKGSRELIKLLDKIAQRIISTPIETHISTPNEMLEIALIMQRLDELSAAKFSVKPVKVYLGVKAAKTKQAIESYLAANNIESIDAYLAQTAPTAIAAKANHLFFSARQGVSAVQMPYQEISPLLTLTI